MSHQAEKKTQKPDILETRIMARTIEQDRERTI